jgi:surfactin synthase thioesterase subunit
VAYPDLPEPNRGESLASFVGRIEIPSGPVIFGGVSMGGMVALELDRTDRTVR